MGNQIGVKNYHQGRGGHNQMSPLSRHCHQGKKHCLSVSKIRTLPKGKKSAKKCKKGKNLASVLPL
jgi:hypothetical protein